MAEAGFLVLFLSQSPAADEAPTRADVTSVDDQGALIDWASATRVR